MNYFQKVIIKSNKNLSKILWTQNGEEIWIDTDNSNKEIFLYRKFNSYTNDNIDLYFATDIDTFNKSFQISHIYKPVIKIDLIIEPNQNKFTLYIDDKII